MKGLSRWAITGTPIQNRWEDLASLLKFLEFDRTADLLSLRAQLRSPQSRNLVIRMFDSLCLRRSKTAISLPTRRDEVHKVQFESNEAELYSYVWDGVLNHLQTIIPGLQDSSYSNVLTKINSLRQICNLGLTYRTAQLKAPNSVLSGSMAAQELFENMLSIGIAVCSRCSKDIFNSEEGSVSPAPNTDGLETPVHPQMSTCGTLVCASCYSFASTESISEEAHCPHYPQCHFDAVCISNSSPENILSIADTNLPTKFKALEQDMSLIPETEKR